MRKWPGPLHPQQVQVPDVYLEEVPQVVVLPTEPHDDRRLRSERLRALVCVPSSNGAEKSWRYRHYQTNPRGDDFPFQRKTNKWHLKPQSMTSDISGIGDSGHFNQTGPKSMDLSKKNPLLTNWSSFSSGFSLYFGVPNRPFRDSKQALLLRHFKNNKNHKKNCLK